MDTCVHLILLYLRGAVLDNLAAIELLGRLSPTTNKNYSAMIDTLVPTHFDGFSYPGHEVKRFSKANNHFQILLRNGNSIGFEPNEEDVERFKDWLLKHEAVDVKAKWD